jgi:hypothetical protein
MFCLRWSLVTIALMVASASCNVVPKATFLTPPTDKGTDTFLPSTPTAQPTLAASFGNTPNARLALRPEFAGDADQLPGASHYTIDLSVSFDSDGSATLAGRELIRYTNQQTVTLDAVVLMLWPNADHQYLSDMTLQHVKINGRELPFDLEQSGLVARVPLPTPLAPGASLEVSDEFVVIAFPAAESERAARFGVLQHVLLAPTFYPMIPHMAQGRIWQTHSASPSGRATTSDSAFYVWRVTTPVKDPFNMTEDLTIIGTGSASEATQMGEVQVRTFAAGPVRDLVLVVGPFRQLQRSIDGITLSAYAPTDQSGQVEAMLDYAQHQVQNLQTEVGPYPFADLDIVYVPGVFGGMEYPTVAVVGTVSEANFFEFTVAHEVGHQWFYSLIGSDPVSEPWLDESAASYTEVLYAEAVYGPEVATQRLNIARDYLAYTDHPSLPIGRPTDAYTSEGDYGIIIYMKGKLFFDALRRKLGDQTFFAFLRNYYAAYRYGFATSADFQAVAELTCTCDARTLFDLWVYRGGSVRP